MVSGLGRKGVGDGVWGFACKHVVGRDRIRTVLFVISESEVHTTTLTSFVVWVC